MLWRVAIIVVVLALGLLAWSTAQSGPPDLTVTSGGKSIGVERGSYCWRSSWSGRCVDTVAPPTLVQDMEPAPVEPGAPVEFRFAREPDELVVHWWATGEPRGAPLTDAWSFAAPAEPGTYVFSVSARWDGRGDAMYAFTIRIEEPSPVDGR